MASAEHGHGHADDGAVHAHVSSPFFYAAIFAALLMLTAATVGQSYVDLGSLNIILVVIIASLKATLVVTFFMHLSHDNRFHALIFVASVFFIGIFFAYTFNDTDRRGELDGDQNVKVLPKTGEPAPGGKVVEEHSSAPAAAPAGGGAAHH